MKSFLFLVTGLLSFNLQAATPFDNLTAAQPQCYGREYSEAHMNKARPNPQTVRSIKLKFFKFPENANLPQYIALQVNAEIRREFVTVDGTVNEVYKPYSNTLGCELDKTKDNMFCYIECDGGSAVVSWGVKNTPNNTIKFTNNGFVLYGGCGGTDDKGNEVNDEDSVFLESLKGGDDFFTVYPLPAEYCQM